jgi:hypothetical protein
MEIPGTGSDFLLPPLRGILRSLIADQKGEGGNKDGKCGSYWARNRRERSGVECLLETGEDVGNEDF